jgi:hypothetical protein
LFDVIIFILQLIMVDFHVDFVNHFRRSFGTCIVCPLICSPLILDALRPAVFVNSCTQSIKFVFLRPMFDVDLMHKVD